MEKWQLCFFLTFKGFLGLCDRFPPDLPSVSPGFFVEACLPLTQAMPAAQAIPGLGELYWWCHFWLPGEFLQYILQATACLRQGLWWPRMGVGVRNSMTNSLGWLKPVFLWIYRDFLVFMKLRVNFHQKGSDGLHKAVIAKESYLKVWTDSEWVDFFLKGVNTVF